MIPEPAKCEKKMWDSEIRHQLFVLLKVIKN